MFVITSTTLDVSCDRFAQDSSRQNGTVAEREFTLPRLWGIPTLYSVAFSVDGSSLISPSHDKPPTMGHSRRFHISAAKEPPFTIALCLPIILFVHLHVIFFDPMLLSPSIPLYAYGHPYLHSAPHWPLAGDMNTKIVSSPLLPCILMIDRRHN